MASARRDQMPKHRIQTSSVFDLSKYTLHIENVENLVV